MHVFSVLKRELLMQNLVFNLGKDIACEDSCLGKAKMYLMLSVIIKGWDFLTHVSQKSDQILQVNVIAPLLTYFTLSSVLNISQHTFRWWTWSPLVIVHLTNPCFEILWMPWKCSFFSSFSMQYIEHSLNSLGYFFWQIVHIPQHASDFRDIWIKMEA